MNRLALVCALALAGVASASAQKIILKTGKTVEGQSIKRAGTSIMTTVRVGESLGTVGYTVDTIERIEFPEPPEIAAANELLLAGKPAQALTRINPVLAAQAPFRDIPGSWWDRAASIKLSALTALRLDDQIPDLITDLARYGKDPEVTRTARIYQARAQVRKKEFDGALATAKTVITESRSPETLANAWIIVGQVELARKDYRAALLAFLRVPVFYPEAQIAMPAALLGAARAYEGIEDFQRSKDTLDELARSFAASPEANDSKEDLKRVTRRLNNS